MSGNDNDDATGKTRSESDYAADKEMLKIHLDLMDDLIAAINTCYPDTSTPLKFDDNHDTKPADTINAEHNEIIYYIDLITRTCNSIPASDVVPVEFLNKLSDLHTQINNNYKKLVKAPFVNFKPKFESVVQFNTTKVLEVFFEAHNRMSALLTNADPGSSTKKRKR